ncbi:MAG TPA: hypothetical protein VG734_09525 [Lacunisphaera sp.]|nr:hypothetical protein [Lacunisphaera sp.]
MNYFPHHPLKRSASPAVRAFAAVRQAFTRDVLWNQHVFKAPKLADPQVEIDPLPFMAARFTSRPAQR